MNCWDGLREEEAGQNDLPACFLEVLQLKIFPMPRSFQRELVGQKPEAVTKD